MLKQGDMAPEFQLADQNGQTRSLIDYRGKWVVLYFYPKDLTPGCTTEACGFRDNYPSFKDKDTVILGISKDTVKRHEKFAAKYDLPFPLLSDEDGKVCDAYDVWKEKSMYGKTFMGITRATYLINPKGTIAHVYEKVKVKEHAAQLLDDLAQNT